MAKRKKQFQGTVNPEAQVDPQQLLGDPLTADYVPWGAYGLWGYYSLMNRNRPPFSYLMIRDMLADPRVIYGLWLLKGPIIANTEFDVKTSRTEVAEYVDSNLRRFWLNSAARVMKAIEWGYSGSEVLYRYNQEDGKIHFDTVKDLESLDCRPVTYYGNVVGFTVRNSDLWYVGKIGVNGQTKNRLTGDDARALNEQAVNTADGRTYIGCPRGIWHTHWRDKNPWFGLSRLYGAHVPWWEQWSEDGYRSIRRLWFSKNAYEGGVIYHPPGQIATTQGLKSTRDYARELIEKKKTGGILTFPNSPSADGQGRAWEYMPPQGNEIPAGLLDYGQILRDEVLEALGIPPEIVQSSGETGFGSASGRQVPQMAFFSILQELAQWLAMDFDTQCLRYLVAMHYGPVPYEIQVRKLSDQKVAPHPNDPFGNENPLNQEDQVDEEGNPLPSSGAQKPPGKQPPPGKKKRPPPGNRPPGKKPKNQFPPQW